MKTPPWSIEREIIIKGDEKTDQTFGYAPNARPIKEHLKYGVVNLDKPSGPTSHETVSWVKRILNIPRAGHTGTLAVKPGKSHRVWRITHYFAGSDKGLTSTTPSWKGVRRSYASSQIC